MICLYIIVGLGNPGREYAGTRHNVGFSVITTLSDRYDIPLDFRRHKAVCGKGVIDGEKVILAMPQTYMNLSGESVRELIDFYKIDMDHLIIVYDDIDLEPGRIRVRPKGSAGGHNGIKSIISHVKTEEFARVKVGVGAKKAGADLANHVLSRFASEDEPKIREALGDAADACITIMSEGIEKAMNDFNARRMP